jgi:hypothetical protein
MRKPRTKEQQARYSKKNREKYVNVATYISKKDYEYIKQTALDNNTGVTTIIKNATEYCVDNNICFDMTPVVDRVVKYFQVYPEQKEKIKSYVENKGISFSNFCYQATMYYINHGLVVKQEKKMPYTRERDYQHQKETFDLVGLTMPIEYKDKITSILNKTGMSLTQFINNACDYYLKNY